MRSIVFALALLVALGLAPPAARAAPPNQTHAQLGEKTVGGPRGRVAVGENEAASARVSEADAARLPRIKATAFGTISPEITCIDPPSCTQTEPQNFALRFDGVFGGAQLDITQPLYTFGKIAHARSAARAGVEAQRALANEAAGDLAVDAARAYWGIKLARELGFMLDDGIEEIGKAITRMDEKTGKDAVSIQDRQRVVVLLAEARAQRADALAERTALAGLLALTGVADADVDDAPLAEVKRTLPASADGLTRPQALAAKQGALAADELAAMARSYYFPDLALVGSANFSRAQGVDDPPSVFANDPFNRQGAGLVVALQWNFEPWTVKARVERASAEATKAKAQSELAAIGARFDAESALAEATGARDKVAAATEGEKAGRTWLASVLQADAIGTAEAKDLADAYLAWFQMRARWAQSVFQWNVAVVRLGRAAGEFRAAR